MSKKMNEFVDEFDNIIKGDEVSSFSNVEANRTTDYNTKVSRQNFSPYFIGRFGFYFFENENSDSEMFLQLVKAIKDDIIEYFEYNKINKLKSGLDDYVKNLEMSLSKLIEENVLINKKNEINELIEDGNKTDEFVKVKTLVDILSNLNKDELDLMTKIIEEKLNE